MFKLLVIDDDPEVCSIIEHLVDRKTIEVLGSQSADAGLRLAQEMRPNVILLDLKLGDRSGLDVFHELRRLDPKGLIIFVTGHGTTDTAIEAMKLGAHDYLVKPLDVNQLEQTIVQACQISRLMHVPAVVDADEKPDDLPDRLIGRGPATQAIGKEIGRMAVQDVNVLILGESGSGKELVARAIYHHSRRSQGPFLAINCAAIPETLLESELFGHEQGAFTGADRRRLGKFEQCHGGTLLLDEVGDMAPNTQAKLLRILEQRTFERVGGNTTISVDVRILAATNQDLESLIEQGRFRGDLYYRLRGVTIQLPPLRHRCEDIPHLAHYFLFRFNRELGTSVQSIAPETLELLQQYAWPGNVRELQSAMREALLRSSGPVLLPEFLPSRLLREDAVDREQDVPDRPTSAADWLGLGEVLEHWLAAGETDLYRRALEHFDRLMVARALEQSDGNQTRASELLGLSRYTLRAKLRSAGLAVQRVVASHSDESPN
jgi:DNA-binding NtrC family response regulator